mgnify:CR=1 FL=1
MKRIYSIIILPLLVACSHTPADHFVLRGIVPGAMDSTEVDLRVDGRVIEPIEGYIIDGKFELKGQLPAGAVYARLSMNNNDIASRKGIREENAVKYVEANIFIENGNLTFSTPHIDSLPQSFWRYDIRRENNYTPPPMTFSTVTAVQPWICNTASAGKNALRGRKNANRTQKPLPRCAANCVRLPTNLSPPTAI